MKNTSFALILLCPLLFACGQSGPLYLPTAKPPIYVEPEPNPKPETKDTETKPAPKSVQPPQSDIKQPTTTQ
jgi:predicted small lipoprotein YifL